MSGNFTWSEARDVRHAFFNESNEHTIASLKAQEKLHTPLFFVRTRDIVVSTIHVVHVCENTSYKYLMCETLPTGEEQWFINDPEQENALPHEMRAVAKALAPHFPEAIAVNDPIMDLLCSCGIGKFIATGYQL